MVAALIQRTQQQMSQVSTALSQIAANSRAAQYLFWLQDHHHTVRRVLAAPRNVPQSLHDGIRLAGVTFTYPGTDRTYAPFRNPTGPCDLGESDLLAPPSSRKMARAKTAAAASSTAVTTNARPTAPPTVRVTFTSAEATPVRSGETRYTAATVIGI